ncbi:MAG: hypothetical protein AAGG75_05745 [Bacteroidota bacterium]
MSSILGLSLGLRRLADLLAARGGTVGCGIAIPSGPLAFWLTVDGGRPDVVVCSVARIVRSSALFYLRLTTRRQAFVRR